MTCGAAREYTSGQARRETHLLDLELLVAFGEEHTRGLHDEVRELRERVALFEARLFRAHDRCLRQDGLEVPAGQRDVVL